MLFIFHSVNSRDLSAIIGSDYSVVSSSITFQPSDTLPKTIAISVLNDNKVEMDETFELLLTTTDNQVTINENKMTITIIDNDSMIFIVLLMHGLLKSYLYDTICRIRLLYLCI